MKRKKNSKRWSPPPEWLGPVDPEQFKFCVNLMGAASSGAMVTPRPSPIPIEGVGEVSFTNTGFNRGMLAVSRHLHEVYPHEAGDIPPQVRATMFRLTLFGDFLAECFEGKHPGSKQFVKRQDDESAEIHDALIEAAATAKLSNGKKFLPDSIFSIAKELIRQESAVSH
jgi:hypothetical protein